MKKFAKVLSLLMALVIVLSFSGCKKSVKHSKEDGALFNEDSIDLKGKTVTVGVLNQGNIPQDDTSRMNDYQKHVNKVRLDREEETEKLLNCNIEWKVLDNKTILSDMKAGTNPADIVYLNSSSGIIDMILEKLIVPLDEYIDFSTGLYSNDVQKATLWNEKHYGLSGDYMRSGQVMSYNKTMLKNAGLSDPYELMKADQWDWNTFLDIAKKVTVPNESDPKNGIWGMIDSDFRSIYINFIYSNGGTLIKESSGKYESSLESPETMEAIKFVTDLYTNSKVLYNTLGSGNNRQQGSFIFRSGKSAFMSGNYNPNTQGRNQTGNQGNNQQGDSQNQPSFPEFETGVVPYPKGPSASGYASYSTAGNNIYAIPSAVKDTKSIAAVLYNLLSIYDSTKSDFINYETEVLSQSSAEQIEVNKVVSPNMEYSWFINDSKYSSTFNNIFSGILTDNKSPEDSIHTQKNTLDTLLNALNQKLSQ